MLSKIVIRAQHGVGSDRQDLIVTVVLHSTHEFSEGLADVFGATSTAARVGGASAGSANREKDVTGTMLEALKAR